MEERQRDDEWREGREALHEIARVKRKVKMRHSRAAAVVQEEAGARKGGEERRE